MTSDDDILNTPPPRQATLEGLRARIDHEPFAPARLTRAEYDHLDESARCSYDAQRLTWFGGGFIFRTEDIVKITKIIRYFEATRSRIGFGGERVLLIDGDANFGKTTCLIELAREVEAAFAKRHPAYRDAGYGPVVYIEMMPNSTPKTIGTAVLDYFGVPSRPRDTHTELIKKASELLIAHRTRVLIVDEMQMLKLDGSTGDAAVNTLKSIINAASITTVLAGIDILADLRSRPAQQLLSRGQSLRLLNHHRGSDAARLRWANLVDAFAHEMLLLDGKSEDLRAYADVLLDVTGGRIGNLRRVLGMAMAVAVGDGVERITPDVLGVAVPGFEPPANSFRKRGAA